jgi:hypothetical protein
MPSSAAVEFPQLQLEQDAFDSQLAEMMKEHAGKFVVFHGEHPVEFFDTFGQAYRAGIKMFGVDETFLISEVRERQPEPANAAWESGAMFPR